jgi:hypothetical protein
VTGHCAGHRGLLDLVLGRVNILKQLRNTDESSDQKKYSGGGADKLGDRHILHVFFLFEFAFIAWV